MIAIHPLPILNISDHVTRARLTSGKVTGALLGTPGNIVNSFEYNDDETFATRRAQFKTVFPALDVIGWYATQADIELHKAFSVHVEAPLLVIFDAAQDTPIRVLESSLSEDSFVDVEYSIETGEAERIAVDATRISEDDQVAGNLSTQRNAIAMLYERIATILEHLRRSPDQRVLRQISSLVASLPVMDANTFRSELVTEYTDVQLTAYLATVLKQLDSLSDYADVMRPNEAIKAEQRRRK